MLFDERRIGVSQDYEYEYEYEYAVQRMKSAFVSALLVFRIHSTLVQSTKLSIAIEIELEFARYSSGVDNHQNPEHHDKRLCNSCTLKTIFFSK